VTSRPVIVSKHGRVFYGWMEWRDGPTDAPPVVTAAGRAWYVETWQAHGWTVEDDTP
jgi:hypothetical protein